MNRRHHLKQLARLAGGGLLPRIGRGESNAESSDARTILLCTGIQFGNIGDVGHVTGILNLLNTWLPEARIILWPVIDVPDFDDLIAQNWPDVEIVHRDLIDGKPENPRIEAAAREADFVIGGHGEGAKIRWAATSFDKPYGIIRVTVSRPPTGSTKEFVDRASFYFTRETASAENLKASQTSCPVYGFAPDATFGSNVQDPLRAAAFMEAHGLEHRKFLCVVPRLRVTPYYRIAPSMKHHKEPWTPERIREVDELNDRHKEEDHSKARATVVAYIRRTGNPVLLCPEMVHNMELFDELLYDPLPDDIKPKVVKHTAFWRTDEASTVYRNAAAVISLECHSPILAYMQGTPAFYLRQPEDTIKGQMYYDIGLSDWVFEIEETAPQAIVDRLMDVVNDYERARKKLERSMDYVRALQRKCLMEIRTAVGLKNDGF
ncbi:MAG: polysaccharide pyruvyl transferase family protein [Verrucomicrobiae bacterium]|nr:polysaccharide pyruvyl transferase family protein [Verrucomicrobiae bacterium]